MSSIVLSRPSLLSVFLFPCLPFLSAPLPQHKNGLFCSKAPQKVPSQHKIEGFCSEPPQKIPSQNKIGCFLC